MRTKRRRKLASARRVAVEPAHQPNQRWSMDFIRLGNPEPASGIGCCGHCEGTILGPKSQKPRTAEAPKRFLTLAQELGERQHGSSSTPVQA